MKKPRLDFSGIAMLIVEPIEFLRSLLKDMLLGFGVGEIQFAQNCDEALDCLKEASFDIVITGSDIEGESYVDFVKRVRKNEEEGGEVFIPILSLVPQSEFAHSSKYINAGVHDIVSLPLSTQRFFLHIQQLVAKPRPFYATQNYFGPDRRWRDSKFPGVDRRQQENIQHRIRTGDRLKPLY